MIHKRIVFSMDNQRWFGDPIEQRHGAALAVIVYSIGETVDFGGDQIVKIANAAQRFQLGQGLPAANRDTPQAYARRWLSIN